MATYRASIEVPVPSGEAFAFVSDFRNAARWDPRVERAEKEPVGPVAVGTRFRLFSRFLWIEVALPYEVVELGDLDDHGDLDPSRRIVLTGRTWWLRYRDTIEVEAAGSGARLTYHAELLPRGLLRLLDPIVAPVFRRMGDDAVAGIRRLLRAQAVRRRESSAGAPPADLRAGVTPEAVEAIVALDERPVLRNLLITQAYHQLSRQLAALLGEGNANWCTFATWASKTAGFFIREDELDAAFRRLLRRKTRLRRRLRELHEALCVLDRDAGLFDRDDDLGPILQVTREVSFFIRAGNREVFRELGGAFAGFYGAFEGVTSPDPGRLDDFLARFRSGESRPDRLERRDGEVIAHPEGGQDLVRGALAAYHAALFETDPKRKAEAILLGSALGGLHEQTRLQAHIVGGLEAPVDELFFSRQNDALAERLGRHVLGEAQQVLHRLFTPLGEELVESFREASTFLLMQMRVPGQVLELGEDLPPPPTGPLYPAALDPIENTELVATLGRYGAYPLRLGPADLPHRLRRRFHMLLARLHLRRPAAWGSAARDWGELAERMRYIFVYFRSRQEERSLSDPPFTPEQTEAILAGHVPAGEL